MATNVTQDIAPLWRLVRVHARNGGQLFKPHQEDRMASATQKPSKTAGKQERTEAGSVPFHTDAPEGAYAVYQAENGPDGGLQFVGYFKGERRSLVVAEARKTLSQNDRDSAQLVTVRPTSIRLTPSPDSRKAATAERDKEREAKKAEREEQRAAKKREREEAAAKKKAEREAQAAAKKAEREAKEKARQEAQKGDG